MAMGDMQSDNFLVSQALSYHHDGIHQDFDQLSGIAFLESHTVARPVSVPFARSEDISLIYAELHKWADQAVARISVHAPLEVDQIREQNRKLIDKLTDLESRITGDAAAVVFGNGSRVSAATSNSDVSRLRSARKRRVSQTIRPNARTTSVSSVPLPVSDQAQDESGQSERPPSRDFKGNSTLTKKLLQIGDQKSRMQVVEYAARLKTPGPQDTSQNALPNIQQLSNASRSANVSHFMRLVVDLGSEIERSVFCEQNSRIRRRIALAHFYHTYTLAQDHPDIFLSWCDNQQMQSGSIPPKGGNKSIVQNRFADLIFPRLESHGSASFTLSSSNADDTKWKIMKIQMWRKSGKKWAQFIQRFGYGILLLLPSCLSDEDLRVAPDIVVASALDLVDSRKNVFADVLWQANELLEAHFFPQSTNLGNVSGSQTFDTVDWEPFGNTASWTQIGTV